MTKNCLLLATTIYTNCQKKINSKNCLDGCQKNNVCWEKGRQKYNNCTGKDKKITLVDCHRQCGAPYENSQVYKNTINHS